LHEHRDDAARPVEGRKVRSLLGEKASPCANPSRSLLRGHLALHHGAPARDMREYGRESFRPKNVIARADPSERADQLGQAVGIEVHDVLVPKRGRFFGQATHEPSNDLRSKVEGSVLPKASPEGDGELGRREVLVAGNSHPARHGPERKRDTTSRCGAQRIELRKHVR
jgi:hypothetical protein